MSDGGIESLVDCDLTYEILRKLLLIREVGDSRTGIFIRDTAYFHCDLLKYESQFIESQ